MSLRPSFSVSSTSPWTTRCPRLTWVSEGKDFRRLREMLKAGEVLEIASLAHVSLLYLGMAAGSGRAASYHGLN